MIDELLRDYLDKKNEHDIAVLNEKEKAALEELYAIIEERSKIGKVNEILCAQSPCPSVYTRPLPTSVYTNAYIYDIQGIFFKPWVGKNYDNGWDGHKTLVLGSHISCLKEECRWNEHCCKMEWIRNVDRQCPKYEDERKSGRGDYYRLSYANIIEINKFIEGEENAFLSAFTNSILKETDYIDKEQKKSFWDSVVYMNYIQHFMEKPTLPDDFDFSPYIDAFKSVLKEFRPTVIFVCTRALCKAIDGFCSVIDGLRPLQNRSESLISGFYVRRFAYKDNNIYEGESVSNNSRYNRPIEHIFPKGYDKTTDYSSYTNNKPAGTEKNNAFLEGEPYTSFLANLSIAKINTAKKVFKWVSTYCVDNKIVSIVEDNGRLKIKDSKLAALIIEIILYNRISYQKLGNLFTSRTKKNNAGYPDRTLGNLIARAKGKKNQPNMTVLKTIKHEAVDHSHIINDEGYLSVIKKLEWVFDEE